MVLLNVMILGGFLFFSVSLGGAIAYVFSKLFQHTSKGLLLLCGGFLVGLLVLDIIPSAFQMYKSFGIILGICIGYLMFLLLHNFFHSANPKNPSVYLLAMAILIHTIPLSLTIGNLLGHSILGITLTTSIILHHVPEGFAFTTALLSQGGKLRGLFLCFISFSIFFILFVWIGHYTNLTDKAQALLVGVSIGLIATTSITEFILHNIRAVSIRSLLMYILLGYILSYTFHLML